MRYLTIEQRESLRDALIGRAALLREEITTNLHRARRPGSRSLAQRIEQYGDRELDALDGLESEIEGSELRHEVQLLRRVKETLTKLRSPQYGICSDCEGDIPFSRLRDDPFATLCRHCQQRADLAPFVPNEM
jgi:RNA polymerase-binding transcription factor DksA